MKNKYTTGLTALAALAFFASGAVAQVNINGLGTVNADTGAGDLVVGEESSMTTTTGSDANVVDEIPVPGAPQYTVFNVTRSYSRLDEIDTTGATTVDNDGNVTLTAGLETDQGASSADGIGTDIFLAARFEVYPDGDPSEGLPIPGTEEYVLVEEDPNNPGTYIEITVGGEPYADATALEAALNALDATQFEALGLQSFESVDQGTNGGNLQVGGDANVDGVLSLGDNGAGAVPDVAAVLWGNISDIADNTSDIAMNTADIATNASTLDVHFGLVTTNISDIAVNAADIATNASTLDVHFGLVTTNISDIAVNAADIATNASTLDVHFGLVSTNISDIAVNAADIATNASTLDVHFGLVSTNISDIAVNAADIATNASTLDVHFGLVSTNISDIAVNAGGIATNAADIATNASTLDVHFGLVSGNISDIAVNAAGIAANAADIATNASTLDVHFGLVSANISDIAVNAAGIATNAADIATNASTLDVHFGLVSQNIADIADIQTNGIVGIIEKKSDGIHIGEDSLVTNLNETTGDQDLWALNDGELTDINFLSDVNVVSKLTVQAEAQESKTTITPATEIKPPYLNEDGIVSNTVAVYTETGSVAVEQTNFENSGVVATANGDLSLFASGGTVDTSTYVTAVRADIWDETQGDLAGFLAGPEVEVGGYIDGDGNFIELGVLNEDGVLDLDSLSSDELAMITSAGDPLPGGGGNLVVEGNARIDGALTLGTIADVEASILDEVAARAAADEVLAAAISAEEVARATADDLLQGGIDEVAANLADEAAARATADADIVAGYQAADAAIVSGYQAADAAIVSGYQAADAAIVAGYMAADAQLGAYIEEVRDIAESNTRGIAMAAALTSPTVREGMENALDFSLAHFDGETGAAISYARRVNENVQLNIAAASDTDFEETIVRGGVSLQW